MAERLAASSRHQYVYNGTVVYEWDQSLTEVNVYVRTPPGITAKQLYCRIHTDTLVFGLGNNDPYLDKKLMEKVKPSESFWTLEDGELHVTLCKIAKGVSWNAVFAGDAALDAVVGEADRKRLMLERFQEEHPGFDFSGAEFQGNCPDPNTFMGGIKK